MLAVFVQDAGAETTGLEVTEYVTAPPFDVEAPQETTDCAFATEAVTELGLVGALIW
nr:hypothetical protein [Candidatus Aquiluna sp. UB-MaderosW2red]